MFGSWGAGQSSLEAIVVQARGDAQMCHVEVFGEVESNS